MVLVNLTVLGALVSLNFPSFNATSAWSVLASDVILPITATCDVVDVVCGTFGISSNDGGFTSEPSSTSKGTVSSIPHAILLVSVLSPEDFTSRVVVPLSADTVVPVRFTSRVVVPLTVVVPDSHGFSSQNSPLPT